MPATMVSDAMVSSKVTSMYFGKTRVFFIQYRNRFSKMLQTQTRVPTRNPSLYSGLKMDGIIVATSIVKAWLQCTILQNVSMQALPPLFPPALST